MPLRLGDGLRGTVLGARTAPAAVRCLHPADHVPYGWMTALHRCLLSPPPSVCQWSPHGWKHVAIQGMTRAHTHHNARYMAGIDVQALETETVQAGARRVSPPALATYTREVGSVIGWDDGRDATFSHVECSGGDTAGRSFHGRPMHPDNLALRDEQ